MCRQLALAIATSLLLSAPSEAVVKSYIISKDAEFTFLNIGPFAAPGATTGAAVINDTGNGTPTLTSLDLNVKWDPVPLTGTAIDAITGVAGSSVAINFETRFAPSPNQTGTGSIASSLISWGSLIGWAQTGQLSCVTTCPTTCSVDACVLAFGFSGTGPPPPLTGSSFPQNWTFPLGGLNFNGPIGGTTFWLIPGSIKFAGNVFIAGGLRQIPVAGLWGAGALAVALIGVGAQRLRRSR